MKAYKKIKINGVIYNVLSVKFDRCEPLMYYVGTGTIPTRTCEAVKLGETIHVGKDIIEGLE